MKSPIDRHDTHTVNLIDTPGHADFTFEVLRSLRILDGAVCVLDGVAGVEAQTEKVWLQANKYSIPRIVFVNKLDRDGAAFGRTVKEIGSRLKGMPAVCQIPWWHGGKGRFTGVGDAINLCALKWEEGGDGKSIQHYSLQKLAESEPALAEEIKKARMALVEALCEFDETLLETWMEKGDDSLAISAEELWVSLRRCVIDGSGRLIPVFAGASFRNIGVQPLLDAVNNLLPDPTERPEAEVTMGDTEGSLADLLAGKLELTTKTPIAPRQVSKKQKQQTALVPNIEGCALAFKVVNDPRRGILVYVRVYSGSIKRNALIWNTNLSVAERANRLLQMYASDAVEIADIPAGQIGVIAGLKYARTGDTLVSMPNMNPKTGPPGKLSSLQLRPIDVPPPVFFAAIEPHSLSEEKNVADILALLLREDPSLHINTDEESGQMHLSGMGELHLEIARDRLVNDFKAKASMGNIEIGYREHILAPSPALHFVFDRDIAGKRGKAGCTTTIAPLEEVGKEAESVERDGNVITVTIETETADSEEPKDLPPELAYNVVRDAMINGAVAALARGPRRSFPLHGCHINLTFNTYTDLFGSDTTPAALSSVARYTVQKALVDLHANAQIGLMEPVMNVVISCDEASLGSIVHDISSARGGQVLSLGDDNANEDTDSVLQPIAANRIYAPPDPFASSDSVGGNGEGHGQQRHITARVPLKEMVGYLKQLRSLTGGRGTFVMSVDRFERLSGPREKALG